MIEWNKRAKKMDTVCSNRRVWFTRCGRYRVDESIIPYGNRKDHNGNYMGYPPIYRALIKRETGWDILSEHRKRKTAVAAVEYYDENGCLPPKKTKVVKAIKRQKAKRKARKEKK